MTPLGTQLRSRVSRLGDPPVAVQQRIQSTICSHKTIGNYEIVKKIGAGSFSTVYLAVHTMTRHEVVLKSSDKFQSNLASEIANMSLLSHPHIVRLYEYIVMSDKVWLVLEYCGGQELYTYLTTVRVIPPAQATRLFAQLAGAVAYAHQFHCAHRDLKLENVLLDNEGNIKLGDFGFTRSYVPRTMLETVCGTESYMAPELLLRQKYDPEAVDAWSLGVILYAMIYGRLPFDDDNSAETLKRIVEEDPVFFSVPKGEHLVDIVRQLLRKNPNDRPRVCDVLNELKEPGKQQKQLLVRITNNPESSYIFSSKEERTVLKGLKALKIDLHMVASSIVQHKCDSLHGLWFTALDRHRSVAKQLLESASPSLNRKKSKASIRSSRSQKKLIKSDLSTYEFQKQDSVKQAQEQEMNRSTNPIENQLQPSFYSMESEGEGRRNSQASDSSQLQLTQPSLIAKPSQCNQSILNFTQSSNLSKSSLIPAKVSNRPLKVEIDEQNNKEPVQPEISKVSELHELRFSGRSKRAMKRLISALKIKRGTKKDNLLAYYDPQCANSPVKHTKALQMSEKEDRLRNGPIFDPLDHEKQTNTGSFGLRGSPVPQHNSSRRLSILSIASSTIPLSFAETPVRQAHSNGHVALCAENHDDIGNDSVDSYVSTDRGNNSILGYNGASTANASVRLSTPDVVPSASENQQFQQLQSHSSQTSSGSASSPYDSSTGANPTTVSRHMSSYSQISQISQLSQSSVDGSVLLADAKEPKTTPKMSQKNRRSSSGIEKKYLSIFLPPSPSISSPPSTPNLFRQRGRLANVKQSMPQKIDEGDE